jgi:hypothetical protein
MRLFYRVIESLDVSPEAAQSNPAPRKDHQVICDMMALGRLVLSSR